MESEFIIENTENNLVITASVGIVSPKNNLNMFYLVKNSRGWDIPGGHIKKGESPEEGFKREFKEETGATLVRAVYIATLKSKLKPKTGINVYYGICCKEKFIFSKEISGIKILEREDAVKAYFGDKKILINLLDICDRRKLFN